MTDQEIAEGCVDHWAFVADRQDCVDALDELVSTDPLRAWQIILQIGSIDVPDRDLRGMVDGVVGVGPLEHVIVFFPEFSVKKPVKKTYNAIINDFVRSSTYQVHMAGGGTFDATITKFVNKYGVHDDITETQMDRLYETFEEKR